MLTREHQQMIDRLSKLSGAQFDKEFIDVMVREHRNALQVFEREANNRNASSQDSTVARELLPQLRRHLTETEQIQRQLESSNIR